MAFRAARRGGLASPNPAQLAVEHWPNRHQPHFRGWVDARFAAALIPDFFKSGSCGSLVVVLRAVVLEGFDEEFRVAFDLKEAVAVVGSAGDDEGAGAGCTGGDRYSAIVTARTSGAKAP